MMDLKHENDVFLSQLVAFTGIYRMSNNSTSPKVYGYNVYKCITVIQLVYLFISLVWLILNIYYCFGNINDVSLYILMSIACVCAIMKLYRLLENADRLYECIQLTSIVNFSYKHHTKQILELGKRKSKSISTVFITFWIFVLVAWAVAPLIAHNLYMSITTEIGSYHYRYNIANLVFPVTDAFYNRHFFTYYIVEFLTILNWAYCVFIFDVLVISLCITLRYQLHTIVNSYSMFSVKYMHLTGDRLNTKQRTKSSMISEFKTLIQDQQVVIENIRNIYQIFRTVLFFQLATDSLVLILLSSITIKNYFDGYSLISLVNMRPIMTSLTYISHIFIYCYLCNGINEQIDSLNFAMYCCGWTEMSIDSKKLLLLAMRTNDGDDLKLRLTTKRVINFEIFASVMQTTYSILSLLANQYKKKTI